MLITFSSEAYANVTLFADVGRKMLNLMGCEETPSGAISAESLQAALSHLEKALASHREVSTTEQSRKSDAAFGDESVSLKMRAIPLIEMLKASIKEKSNVFWESK